MGENSIKKASHTHAFGANYDKTPKFLHNFGIKTLIFVYFIKNTSIFVIKFYHTYMPLSIAIFDRSA